MKTSGVNEFRAMIRTIVETSDKAGFLGAADIEGIADEWAQKVAAARDASVAAALDAQAEFYWEASTLLDPAKSVAEMQGEDGMGAILDAQIRTMREVSTRLRRRAAEWRGLSAEDQAIHDMAAGPVPAAAGPLFVPPLATHEVLGDITAAYYQLHPDLDPARVSLEFSKGPDGWYVVGHMPTKDQAPAIDVPSRSWQVSPPQGLASVMDALNAAYLAEHPELDPGRVSFEYRDDNDEGRWYVAGHVCCACCQTGESKCYCPNSTLPKAKWCKCDPCKKARADLK